MSLPPCMYFMASNGVDDVSLVLDFARGRREQRRGARSEVGLADWTLGACCRLADEGGRGDGGGVRKQTCSRTRLIHFPIGKPSL